MFMSLCVSLSIRVQQLVLHRKAFHERLYWGDVRVLKMCLGNTDFTKRRTVISGALHAVVRSFFLNNISLRGLKNKHADKSVEKIEIRISTKIFIYLFIYFFIFIYLFIFIF